MSDQSNNRPLYVDEYDSHKKYYWEKILNEMEKAKEISPINIVEDIQWREIRAFAKGDEELRQLLERVKILYYLKKNDGQ